MAWTAPRTWVASETLTAALLNTHVRDNLLETMPAKVTTAGDITYATGANTLTRLGIGSASAVLVARSGAPAWSNAAVTASGGAAIGVRTYGTLTAAANSDILYNLFIDPAFARGTYTGLTGIVLTVAAASATGTGTINNCYGVYLNEQTVGTTNWTLYCVAGNTRLGGTSSSVYIGDTSNANMTAGLTINQGAADNEALALKSSDVAHGITGVYETDTYATFTKYTAATGGLKITGINGGTSSGGGVEIFGVSNTVNTLKTTGALGAVIINGGDATGAPIGVGGLTANANIVVFRDLSNTRFILDADGDSHQDVGTAWTNFDDRDDVQALNLLAAHVTRSDDPLRAGFSQWLEQSREPLEAARIVTFNDDGHHFVNWSRANMLVIGAVRQLGAQLAATAERLAAAEAKLALLEA